MDNGIEFVYAFAGTNLTNGKDWINNIKQLFGKICEIATAISNARKFSEQIEGNDFTN